MPPTGSRRAASPWARATTSLRPSSSLPRPGARSRTARARSSRRPAHDRRMRRLVIFDRTQLRRPVGLTTAWSAGVRLYRALGRIDGSFGAASWAEALDWVLGQDGPVAELQFWGHG